MRMSRLFGTTLREAPGGADAVSQQLLLRAGYLRPLGQGIFSYLPLGWRVMRRIGDIMREEMDAAGGVEVSLPVVHPAEIWRQSGRWDAVGPELARLVDRRDRDLALAMTHEEVVASLAATEIRSWRDLPRLVYQIQLKFRDDARPRAGLIRAREFTMKDAYSLDKDSEGLDAQYARMHAAYTAIFERCGLPSLAVGADVGMMGGSGAHEFMYLTPIGEDTLVLCDHCGYAQNRQVAVVGVREPLAEEQLAVEEVATPGASTIEALAAALDVPAERTAKVVFVAASYASGSGAPFVVAVVRGDTTLNETKLANVLGASDLRPMTTEEIEAIGCVPGYASPVGLDDAARVVVDLLAAASPNLVAGANRNGYHLRNVNLGRDYVADLVADLVAAEDGDPCSVCGSPLRTTRGVEIGNIFKLGTKYAEAMGASYLGEDGQEHPVVMGSYGIGVGRLLACVAEEHHDERGLVWPRSIAPFAVHVCVLGEEVRDAAEELYTELAAAGVDVLLDDRGERPGVQFADADLIGVPLRLVVSSRARDAGGVEARRRSGGDAEVIARSSVLEWVSSELAERPDTR
ncbi:MAG TPA: proline--tRNA ligase [Acidimicrobiales bacterium]|nr:proline--tRNA ligase [Acidimicrobiales bacterium]